MPRGDHGRARLDFPERSLRAFTDAAPLVVRDSGGVGTHAGGGQHATGRTNRAARPTSHGAGRGGLSGGRGLRRDGDPQRRVGHARRHVRKHLLLHHDPTLDRPHHRRRDDPGRRRRRLAAGHPRPRLDDAGHAGWRDDPAARREDRCQAALELQPGSRHVHRLGCRLRLALGGGVRPDPGQRRPGRSQLGEGARPNPVAGQADPRRRIRGGRRGVRLGGDGTPGPVLGADRPTHQQGGPEPRPSERRRQRPGRAPWGVAGRSRAR